MAQIDMNVVQEFVDEIKQPQQEQNSVYGAIVSRIDSEGVVWINIAGSDKETPTALTSSEVKKGDYVSVEFRNNKWYIAGNYTDRSVGVQRVYVIEQVAQIAESNSIQAVQDSAQAVSTASEAVTVARTAETTAGGSVITDTLHYLATSASSNVTIDTPGWTTTVQQIDSTNRYLWTYHTYTKANGQATNTQPVITGTYGVDGTSVTILGSYNTLAELEAAHPTGSLGDAYMVSGDLYVWNGSAWENVGQIQGPQGDAGVGITLITEYYAINNSTSAPADADFSTTVKTPTTTNRYLWIYELVTYTDGSSEPLNKHIAAVYGQTGPQGVQGIPGTNGSDGSDGSDGISVTRIVNYYLATFANSGVNTSTPGWTTSVQTMTATNQYLWNYEIVYGTGDVLLNTTTPTIIGRYGQNGTNGTNGISITAVQSQYYLSTSATSATGGSWNNTLTYESGKYIWTRDAITYSNSTTGYSTAIYNSALTSACVNAESALQIAEDTNQYFWHTETGTDTGVHITEVPKEDFEADPTNGGGNLLARSNGIAVRDGLTELATFGASGAQIGQSGAAHSVVDANGQRFYASDGSTELANIGYGEGVAQSGTATAPYYTFGTRSTSASADRGNYSSAEGFNVKASGYCSHAEGRNATASGDFSHDEGNNSTASGTSAHAEGDATTASGYFSHAQNCGTQATTRSQTVIGEFNEVGPNNDPLSRGEWVFVIGNGNGIPDDPKESSNALTVDWNGNIEAAGDITVGGHSSPIGKVESAAWTASSSASSGAALTGEITLTPGVWLIVVSLPGVSRTHQYYLSNISSPTSKYYSAVSQGTFSCIYQATSTISTKVMSAASASTTYSTIGRGHLEAVRIA